MTYIWRKDWHIVTPEWDDYMRRNRRALNEPPLKAKTMTLAFPLRDTSRPLRGRPID